MAKSEFSHCGEEKFSVAETSGDTFIFKLQALNCIKHSTTNGRISSTYREDICRITLLTSVNR